MQWTCAIHCGSYQPHVSIKHQKYGQSKLRSSISEK